MVDGIYTSLRNKEKRKPFWEKGKPSHPPFIGAYGYGMMNCRGTGTGRHPDLTGQ